MFRHRQKKGFTLIEVTLAIVIGIIMIAGATLIYNQAKTSAGNSRAQAKVVALQQLIEEFAAQNQGIYPASISDVNALWKRKRPDDWNKSPWGGLTGTTYVPTDLVNGLGVLTTTVPGTATAANTLANIAAPGAIIVRPFDGVAAANVGAPGLVGGLAYDYDSANAVWSYSSDVMTNRPATVKGYAVYICDQQGRYPNFVTGGKANM
jgi:prepilin-type N-terminal cleavage/methylation domain-containing protein